MTNGQHLLSGMRVRVNKFDDNQAVLTRYEERTVSEGKPALKQQLTPSTHNLQRKEYERRSAYANATEIIDYSPPMKKGVCVMVNLR